MSKKAISTTDTLNTLQLYSKNAIGAFAILFSPFFGALLLSHNLRRLNNKVASRWVFVFGVLYTTASIGILQLTTLNTNLAILLNVIGAGILTHLFWNRHIGKTTEFTAKHWSKPALLIVGSLIFAFLVYAYWFQIIEWIGMED